MSFSVVQAGQNGKCAFPTTALRTVSCLSPQSSVLHYRPSFFTLGAELLNGLGSNGSWTTVWAELQPSLPVSGRGQPEPCPSCCWEGKVPAHWELQLPNLDGCHWQGCAELALSRQLMGSSTNCPKPTLAMLLQHKNPEQTLFPVRDQILTTHCLESLWGTTGCLLFRSHLVRMISLPKAGKKIKCSKNIKKVIIVTQCYFLQTLMQQKLRLYVNEETPRKAQGHSKASSMHWNKVLACR